MNKTRMEAFSDGVMAIIITIMVLEIKVPHSADWAVVEHLLPVLFSYVLSFVFVGIYWVNHHHLLHTVKHISSGMLWANLHLLLWLSMIPVATGWIGEEHFATNTVVVYAVLLLMCGIAFTILQHIIETTNLRNTKMEQALDGMKRKGLLSVVFYGAAIPLAYVNTIISGALFVIVALMWFIPDKTIERASMGDPHDIL